LGVSVRSFAVASHSLRGCHATRPYLAGWLRDTVPEPARHPHRRPTAGRELSAVGVAAGAACLRPGGSRPTRPGRGHGGELAREGTTQ